MAVKVLNKMMGFFGMEDEFDEFDELENEEEKEEKSESKGFEYEDEFESFKRASSNKNKIVNIHTASAAKIVILKPHDYDEATTICDNLKNRKIVVVNTTALEQKVGQRLLDFISGASYSLSATLQEVEKGIYLLSPSNIEVDSLFKEEISDISNKGLFSFMK